MNERPAFRWTVGAACFERTVTFHRLQPWEVLVSD
jgi:hypothetical protein